MKIKGILFDVDGTLLNTREFVYQAFTHSLKTLKNIDVTYQQLDEIQGINLVDCYKMLSKLDDVTDLCEAHRAFQDAHLHLSKPYPGVKKVLQKLADENIIMAAVSSRGVGNLAKTLELAAILDYFETVISADDVNNHKPHPEPILLGLSRLKVEPEEALMVGDTFADILGGKAANVKTVWASYGSGRKDVIDLKPDFVIKNAKELEKIMFG